MRRSLKRMKRLVDAELVVGRHAAGVPLMRDRVTVHPDAGPDAG